MPVEIEGKVSSSAGCSAQWCWPGSWCLNGSIVSLISICFAISDKGSPYTSSTSFSSMKLGAKRIVESMKIAGDRVAVKTFPGAMLEKTVFTLYVPGSVSR